MVLRGLPDIPDGQLLRPPGGSVQVGGGEPGWQQRFDVAERLGPGQFGEHPTQVGVGFESVGLRALDERVQPGARPGVGHGIGEQPTPTPEAKWADGIFTPDGDFRIGGPNELCL